MSRSGRKRNTGKWKKSGKRLIVAETILSLAGSLIL